MGSDSDSESDVESMDSQPDDACVASDSFNMLARGDYMMACAYAVSSVAGSLVALTLGVVAMRMVAA